jgi:putative transposase
MANTYTQIYVHVVFAVSGRACVISPGHREDLQKYITGIVTRKGQKLIAIYCMPDHTHVLVGLKPNIAPSELIGDIKTGSTNHITSGNGSGVIFPGRKATGRFPCPIRIWIASSNIFVIRPRIIAESLSKRNTLSF